MQSDNEQIVKLSGIFLLAKINTKQNLDSIWSIRILDSIYEKFDFKELWNNIVYVFVMQYI